MGFKTPIRIREVIEGIQSGQYVLPAIQREFVWNQEQIERLFDSLLRGYPIGSFLFWKIEAENLQKYQFYNFMDKYHERDHRHAQPISLVGNHSRTAILDGQQRLTALNIGLTGSYAIKKPWARWTTSDAFPERRLYVNLRFKPTKDPDVQYEFRMLTDKESEPRDSDHYWFKVGDILNFTSIDKAFFFCVGEKLAEQGNRYPSETLIKLWRAISDEPLINYYEEDEQDLDKVLNIFIRVNSGGTVLSYSDMLLSIATAQWQKIDARKEVHGVVDELNQLGDGFSFDKDFVLKACLVLADVSAIEFRVGSFTRNNMRAIEERWNEIRLALRQTALLLSGWGFNGQSLTSNYAAMPIAYYLYKKGSPATFLTSTHHSAERDEMRRWLLVALLKRAFSGQTDTVLREVRSVLQNGDASFPAAKLRTALTTMGRSMTFTREEIGGLLDYKYGQAYTYSVLALLYPWLKFDQKYHVDHIHPRSRLTPSKVKSFAVTPEEQEEWLDAVNSVANLQLLQGVPNTQKSDKLFSDWLAAEYPLAAQLAEYRKNHYIPDMDLSIGSFLDFVRAREALLTEAIADAVGVDQGSSSPNGAALTVAASSS